MKFRFVSFWKTWWHCLIRIFNIKEDHRMCEVYTKNSSQLFARDVRHFCSCGYLNSGITWQQMKDDLDKRYKKV